MDGSEDKAVEGEDTCGGGCKLEEGLALPCPEECVLCLWSPSMWSGSGEGIRASGPSSEEGPG